MAKARKIWTLAPPKRKQVDVPDALRTEVEAKATDLIDNVLKPKHVKPACKDEKLNYVIDMAGKWHRRYFYFFSTYACPGPTAISPTFESKFARLEYLGDSKFTLSFMRHTGAWVELLCGVLLDECLRAVRDDPWFQP